MSQFLVGYFPRFYTATVAHFFNLDIDIRHITFAAGDL